MPDLRCTCGSKLAEYNENSIRIMCRKSKEVVELVVIGGRLERRMPPLENFRKKIKGDWMKEAHDAHVAKD